MGMGGGLKVGLRWRGTSGIEGSLFVILPFVLFMVCVKSLECMLFVFLVSISDLPGIFCDRLDTLLID